MPKFAFYAVKQGRAPGVYTSWDECAAQVQRFPGAIYKGFHSEAEAEAFCQGKKTTKFTSQGEEKEKMPPFYRPSFKRRRDSFVDEDKKKIGSKTASKMRLKKDKEDEEDEGKDDKEEDDKEEDDKEEDDKEDEEDEEDEEDDDKHEKRKGRNKEKEKTEKKKEREEEAEENESDDEDEENNRVDFPKKKAQKVQHILRFDGGARGNPGPGGCGAALWECDLVRKTEKEIWAGGKYFGWTTNNFAEYSGLLLGLKQANKLRVKEILIMGDSQLVISQLKGKFQVKSAKLLPLFQKAQDLLAEIPRYTLKHIPRAQNQRADALANQAMDRQGSF